MPCYWDDDFSGILTDKWTDISTGVGSAQISGGVLLLDSGATASAGFAGVDQNSTVAGDFSVKVKISMTTDPIADYSETGLVFYIDATHYMTINAYGHASDKHYKMGYVNGGGPVEVFAARSNTIIWVKISRSGSSVSAYYSTDDSTYTQLGASISIGSGDGIVRLRISKSSGNPRAVAELDNFQFISGCPVDPVELATVVTNAITDITAISATGNGEVISDGGGTISERGFCWSISINPTISDNKVTVSGTTGVLSGTLSGLSPYTLYHVRCFATNNKGTAYGEDRSFLTLSIAYTEFEEMEGRTFSKPIFIVTMGSFEVPNYDIMDLDQLTLSRADDFSVATSDITITLNNNTGKYSPGKSNFIWTGESWFHQSCKIEFTYQDITEKITLFEGYITKWNLKDTKDAGYDSAVDGSFVEVTAEDHCSMLGDRMIGVPNDDGSLNPFVHGHIFRQAEELGAQAFWTPDYDFGFETGDFTGIDSVVGSASVVSTDPFEGTYCAKFESQIASDCAYCKQDLNPGSYEFHVSAYFKFETIPDPAYQNNVGFIAINDDIDRELISVTMNREGLNQYYLTLIILGFEQAIQTKVDLSDYLNIWVKMDLIVRNDRDNNQIIAKLFFNGDEIHSLVLVVEITNLFRYAVFGAKLVSTYTNTPWVVYVDEVKLYTEAYPFGYYLSGGAYESINGIYVDGSFWPKKNKSMWNPYWFNNAWQYNYISYYGKGTLPENYRTNLSYCLVDFLDYNNQPSGSILIDATKDSIDHPVDQIESILTEVDLDSRIDSTNFAIAKTINANDTVGIYIDNQSAADAITAICQNTFMSFVERQGEFGILPFTGTHLLDYEKILNITNCHSFEQTIDMDNLQTQVDVVWGWYDRDKHLFYRVKNDEMISIVGNQSTKLDLSYGQDVSSNNSEMAKTKARLLLNRFSGPLDEIIIKGDLSLIRIEIGDGVLIQDSLNDVDLIYEVIEKVIDFNDKTVEFRIHRYGGNGIGAISMGSSTIAPLVVISGDATISDIITSSIARTDAPAIIVNGDYFYSPETSEAIGITISPTVIYGSINISPTNASAIGTITAPTVVLGDIWFTPMQITSIGSTIDPTVDIA